MLKRKRCSMCDLSLPVSEFGINGKRKDGAPRPRSHCKHCYSVRQHSFYLNRKARNVGIEPPSQQV